VDRRQGTLTVGGRLSTFDLLIKVVYFVTKKYLMFAISIAAALN
jgi:hypothetical protein